VRVKLYKVVSSARIFGIKAIRKQKLIKKYYKDGKIFPQHNIHVEFITRISLKLIFSFVIEVSTSYLRDGFIYIKLEESKAVLLN